VCCWVKRTALLEQNHKQKELEQTMEEKNSSSAVLSETNSTETSQSSTEEAVQRHWQGVVKRRSFLKGLGIAGATLSAGALLTTEGNAAGRAKQRQAFPKATLLFCGSPRRRNHRG